MMSPILPRHLRVALPALAFFASLMVLGLRTPLAAQEQDSIPESVPNAAVSGLQVRLRAGGAFIGNFFQSPEGVPNESVRAGTSELRFALPFSRRAEVFANLGGTFYSDFDPSGDLGGGVRWSARPHEFQATGGYQWRAPRVEVGDTLGFANIVRLGGIYRIRPVRAVQFGVLADYSDETYNRSSSKDNTFLDLGGSLRYRGLDYIFSPEVGAAFGSRDVVDDREDFDQRTLWVAVSSIPSPALYISARYRNRLREYAIADPIASNFGREDWRHQITLTAEVAVRKDLAWTAYYSFEKANSTKVSRNFDTQYIWTGLTYRFR